MRRTLDGDMKEVRGQTLEKGAGWIRYLGKEWIVHDGIYAVRVPPSYWFELLDEVGLIDCRAVAMPAEVANTSQDDEVPLSSVDHQLYRHIIGKLMYGAIVRPDL
eukprot:11770713-Heterocapsa_arctica.AAC.1